MAKKLYVSYKHDNGEHGINYINQNLLYVAIVVAMVIIKIMVSN